MGNPIQHGIENDTNIVIDVTYDKGGRVLDTRDPNGNLTTYEHDQLGRRTQLTNPLGHTWDTSYETLANSTRVTTTYPGLSAGGAYDVDRDFDRLGRITGITYDNPVSTPNVTYSYDAITGDQTLMAESNGTQDIRRTSYSYDAAHRMIGVGYDSDADGTPEQTVSYAYDIVGQRSQLSFDGMTIEYEYNALGQLTRMRETGAGGSGATWGNATWGQFNWGSSTSGLDANFSYDQIGRHIQTARDTGMTTDLSYDAGSRLTRVLHTDTAGTLADFQYTLNGRGHRTQAVETVKQPDGSSQASTVAYAYDVLSRLLSATYSGDRTDSYNYGYDRNGNLVDLDGTTRTYNALNQMTNDGTLSLTYDANGNLTSDGSDSYTWDQQGRLVSVGNTQYVYDGSSYRISKTVAGVTTEYLNDVQSSIVRVLSETTAGSQTRYLNAHGRVIAQQNPAGNWLYPVADGLSTLRSMISSGNVVLETREYTPYGELVSLTGSSQTDVGFTGEFTDENGLVNLRYRYYSPSQSQFISRDRVENVNRYAYTSSDPVNRIDPNGLQDFIPEICIPKPEGNLGARALQGARYLLWDQHMCRVQFGWNLGMMVFGENPVDPVEPVVPIDPVVPDVPEPGVDNPPTEWTPPETPPQSPDGIGPGPVSDNPPGGTEDPPPPQPVNDPPPAPITDPDDPPPFDRPCDDDPPVSGDRGPCDNNIDKNIAAVLYGQISRELRDEVHDTARAGGVSELELRDARYVISFARVRNSIGNCVGMAASSNLYEGMTRKLSNGQKWKDIIDDTLPRNPNVDVALRVKTGLPSFDIGHAETNIYYKVNRTDEGYSQLRAMGTSHPGGPCGRHSSRPGGANCRTYFRDKEVTIGWLNLSGSEAYVYYRGIDTKIWG
jgi:RHS repeat-associated protein